MNDFTKEELLIIWLAIPANYYLKLKNKIQFMLDNYTDFTKEELEELMHCVYAYRDLCDEDVEDSLCNKLKSMIDNYYETECEHNWFECFYGENRAPINVCSLCNSRERR